MKPIYVLHLDLSNGQYFIVTRNKTEKLITPPAFRALREFRSNALAILEMNRLQAIRNHSMPAFLVEQAL
jgi:hypothetical protein